MRDYSTVPHTLAPAKGTELIVSNNTFVGNPKPQLVTPYHYSELNISKEQIIGKHNIAVESTIHPVRFAPISDY